MSSITGRHPEIGGTCQPESRMRSWIPASPTLYFLQAEARGVTRRPPLSIPLSFSLSSLSLSFSLSLPSSLPFLVLSPLPPLSYICPFFPLSLPISVSLTHTNIHTSYTSLTPAIINSDPCSDFPLWGTYNRI